MIATSPPTLSADTDRRGIEYFERHIRPVLVEKCYPCHSASAKEVKGGLRLDSKQAMQRGGESGPAVVPGDADQSLIVRALQYADDFYQMPPDEKLPAGIVSRFVQWIEMGAPDPRDDDPEANESEESRRDVDVGQARRFWAFQPPEAPEIPEVDNRQWCRSPIDRFVLADLEAAGLEPAPAADRRTLIRRATYDLIGLPPAMEEINEFLSDTSPNAFRRVVDRLLASPRYGERWGRHWLDVARYADSNGLDENLAYAHAFRYRDYVIDSFNSGLPYDVFVREQLAGDLLAAPEDELLSRKHARWIATGFLSLGPKMLACDDGRKMELDIVDEQLDTTSRAFMGVTMGCARCHDHKFDPISTREYYALAGVFKSTKTMEHFNVVAQWHEYSLATPQQQAAAEAHEQKLAAKTSEIDRRQRSARNEFLDGERRRAADYLAAASELVAPTSDEVGPPVSRKQADVAEAARLRQLNAEILRRWVSFLNRGPHELISAFADEALPAKGSDPEAYESIRNRIEAAIEERNDNERGSDKETIDERNSRELQPIERILFGKDGPYQLPENPGRFYTEQAKAELKELNEEKKRMEQARPKFDMAMGVTEGKIEDLRVHIRGNYLTLGDVATRRFPQVLSLGQGHSIDPSTSGRLALAQWLTHRRHPLTARVMANRAWLWHFGEGIVRTPDNFGRLGERPTNQALLDWLAISFVKSQWSVKHLHRAIMMSSTYQMSSRYDGLAAEKDPHNRLWWRFPRQRLDAEQIRDSILAVANNLNLEMHGQLMPDKNRDYVTGTGSKQGTYDFRRRSVYLPILRSAVYPVFQAFDFGDPSVIQGRRATTTVAPQGLFMMNGEIVSRAASRLAEELVQQRRLDDRQRATAAYEHILRRAPTREETARALTYIDSYAENTPLQPDSGENFRQRAWQSLCRALVASNEFVYLD